MLIISIGDIANELIKYSSNTEMSFVGHTPILKSYISKREGPTRAYVYIAQVGNNKFTAYSDIFDINGARFIPTGLIQKPFVRELDKIHEMYGGDSTISNVYLRSVENVPYSDIIDFIFNILIENDILYVNGLHSKIGSYGFNNPKIARVLERSFNSYGIHNTTPIDLYKAVVRDKNKFILNGLKAKDMKCIADKLSDRGVYVTLNNDHIVDVTFRRR